MVTEEETRTATGGDDSRPLTMEDYLNLESEAFRALNHGDIVDGVVVRVDPNEVLVDVGAKSEGIITSKELGFRGEQTDELHVGDEVKVFVLQPENDDGNVVLSLRRAKAETTWITANEKQATGEVLEAEVREQNKGGLIVKVLGLRGFLPSSQVSRAHAGNLESLVAQRIFVKILEVNRKRNRLIVSQKAAFDEDRARKRDELFERLKVGDIVHGTVSGLTSYGAFVDLGGADGLIHISEVSWERVAKVTDVLNVGDELDVKVIKLDPGSSRISLSLRELEDDPWDEIERRFTVGMITEGEVTKIKKYGAFCQIADGVEGLLHVSELSWEHVEKVEDVLEIGQPVQVKVIATDRARRRISLSIKQLQERPGGLPPEPEGGSATAYDTDWSSEDQQSAQPEESDQED
ncbi:MAG: 30S ribosomal protein S1 [Candidatus Dormibacteria bacterium]